MKGGIMSRKNILHIVLGFVLCLSLSLSPIAVSQADAVPLTSLEPTPDFILVAKASRAWTATVEKGEDLPGVLQAAIEHIETKRTHALVEIKVRP